MENLSFTIILLLSLALVSFVDLLTAVICYKKNKQAFFKNELNSGLSWYLDKFSIRKSMLKMELQQWFFTAVFVIMIYFSSDIFGINKLLGVNIFLFAYILCSFVGVISNIISYIYVILEDSQC